MPVVITVDVEYGDRPSAEPLSTFAQIRRVIEGAALPVTYFVQGRFARAHPELVGELAATGATLGIHGYTHIDHRRLSTAGIRAETGDALGAIARSAPGTPVRFARLPHGHGGGDPEITGVLAEFGLTSIGWDFSTFDWDESLDLDAAAGRALRALDGGGIVLFHSWPARTPELISRLIAAAQGEVVSLGEVELRGTSPNGRILRPRFEDPPRSGEGTAAVDTTPTQP